MKRLWPYLLLNVAISALTMLAVLLIWNATHRTPAFSASDEMVVNPTQEVTIVPTRTLPAKTEELFEIDAVVGAGDLANEYVNIKYLGREPLDLQGWQIFKGNQKVFTFPAFVIYKGGAFDLHTRAGSASAIDLYIGRSAALWSGGDMLYIKDPEGSERLRYRVP